MKLKQLKQLNFIVWLVKEKKIEGILIWYNIAGL